MRWWGRSGGSGGYAPPVPAEEPYSVDFAWVGNVSDSGADVKFRSVNASAPKLLVSESSDLSTPTEVDPTEGSDKVWTASITGLDDDTLYYYGFDRNELTGQFRTFPTPGTAHSFTIAAASCGGGSGRQYPGASGTTNAPTFDRIQEHDPLVFIHMGDMHYRNLNTTNVSTYYTAYKDVLACSRFADLVSHIPTLYRWDDHDFGPNDSNGTYSGKATSRQAYTDYVPHWDLPGNGIEQTFVIGRVRFIILDARYERTPNSASDNSSKTRLGATQKQWLKDTLDNSTEPLVVIDVGSWIGGTSSFSDGWDGFATDRTELFDYFRSEGHWDRLFLMGGDIHELMWDDGTNTNFETTPSGNGPPYAGFAPIDASFNHFSATVLERYQTRRQQYGTLDFTDTGTEITVRARGWALSASPGSTSSAQFDHSVIYTG